MESVIDYKSIVAAPDDSLAIIKDVDEKQGRIIGYFSVFGNIDSDKDMMMPGAFKKSLSENSRRIKHLYQHDPWKPLAGVKGNRLVISEDKTGLLFDSTISQTSYGRDVIQLYMDGVIEEHSVGFQTVRSNERSSYREITEVKLWEGSTVTWGANDLAMATSVKSMTKETLFKRMETIMKSIRNGRYENEDVFDQLELYFKQLQQLFMDMNANAEARKTELQAEPVARDWKELTKFLMQ